MIPGTGVPPLREKGPPLGRLVKAGGVFPGIRYVRPQGLTRIHADPPNLSWSSMSEATKQERGPPRHCAVRGTRAASGSRACRPCICPSRAQVPQGAEPTGRARHRAGHRGVPALRQHLRGVRVRDGTGTADQVGAPPALLGAGHPGGQAGHPGAAADPRPARRDRVTRHPRTVRATWSRRSARGPASTSGRARARPGLRGRLLPRLHRLRGRDPGLQRQVRDGLQGVRPHRGERRPLLRPDRGAQQAALRAPGGGQGRPALRGAARAKRRAARPFDDPALVVASARAPTRCTGPWSRDGSRPA